MDWIGPGRTHTLPFMGPRSRVTMHRRGKMRDGWERGTVELNGEKAREDQRAEIRR
jgi:hypothetical protein